MDRVYRRAASCPVRHAVRYPPGVTLMTLRRAAHASPVAIALLIVANLVPLFGVLFFGWSLTTIVALYWLENGVVGAFALARMATAEGVDEDPGSVSINGRQLSAAELRNPVSARVVLMPFFVMHYGMFWLVHGVFVWFALPMVWEQMGGATAGPSLVACLWALPVLFLSHAALFVRLVAGRRVSLHLLALARDGCPVWPGRDPPRDDRDRARYLVAFLGSADLGAGAARGAQDRVRTSRPTSPRAPRGWDQDRQRPQVRNEAGAGRGAAHLLPDHRQGEPHEHAVDQPEHPVVKRRRASGRHGPRPGCGAPRRTAANHDRHRTRVFVGTLRGRHPGEFRERADDAVLEPVQRDDSRRAPAEEQHADAAARGWPR